VAAIPRGGWNARSGNCAETNAALGSAGSSATATRPAQRLNTASAVTIAAQQRKTRRPMSAAQMSEAEIELASHEILQPMREKIARIEWSGRGFGVELNCLDRQVTMLESFVRSVVEVNHGLFESVRERGGIDGVSMIVRGNDHLSALQILDRLIAATMPVR